MLRHKYPSCAGCHVSPGGGGALTAYGRVAAEELLSTSSYEGESGFLHFESIKDERIAIGGDIRYLNMATETPRELAYKNLSMQTDFELAIRPVEWLWIDGAYGSYNDNELKESRRHYVSLLPVPYLSLRFGKFMHTFGYMHQDHSAFNRSLLGLNEGQESYNVEGALLTPVGEWFMTAIILTKTYDENGDAIYRGERNGWSSRLSFFLTPMMKLGVSLMRYNDKTLRYGSFAEWALSKILYIAGDLNEEVTPLERRFVGYGKTSVELYRGINLIYETNYKFDATSVARANYFGLDLFPRPHFEILGKIGLRDNFMNYLLVTHYYF